MIRGFEEQFEEKTINDISKLLKRIKSFSLPTGVSRYYAVDLSLCLQAGALLGALQVASSLLEIFVREVVIERASEAYSESHKVVGALQKKLEEKKNVGFKQLVVELASSGEWSTADAEMAKQFYDDVRIPIHHGLPARFFHNIENYQSVMEALLGYTQQVTHRDFEKVIEENALALIDTAVGIIERNSK